MGRFNFGFGRRKQETASYETEGTSALKPEMNPWQEMADEMNAEREVAEKQKASTERQQRKIVACMLTGDYNVIWDHDVALPMGAEDEVLRRLGAGEITKQDEEEFLLKIGGPIHKEGGAGRILGKLEQDEWQKQLFGWTTGRTVSGKGVESVFEEIRDVDLRTPVGFEERREGVLEWLKPQVSEQQYAHYEKSMDDLEKTLYGKRFEYYQAFEGLREKAVGGQDLLAEEQPTIRKQEVYWNGWERQEELLRSARIDGDVWKQNGRDWTLTTEVLRNNDLGPKYKAQIENQEVDLSDVYELGGGRVAAVAYVPTNDGVKVRSYYRSNSQGVWRYMPDYARSAQTGEGIGWYGKSYSEEATTLPYALQEALATIMESQGVKEVQNTNPKFIFAGTAKAYDSIGDYQAALGSGQMRGDFYDEVSSTSDTQEFGRISYDKQRPEDINMRFGYEPDFGRVMADYKSESGLVGKMETEVFQSNDGRYNWLMCTDAKNRSWVGGIETSSPITSTGCRKEWVSAGDVVTPLYEYERMSSGYGDYEDVRPPHYVGMWKNYLSRMPLIRKYQEYKYRRGY